MYLYQLLLAYTIPTYNVVPYVTHKDVCSITTYFPAAQSAISGPSLQ